VGLLMCGQEMVGLFRKDVIIGATLVLNWV